MAYVALSSDSAKPFIHTGKQWQHNLLPWTWSSWYQRTWLCSKVFFKLCIFLTQIVGVAKGRQIWHFNFQKYEETGPWYSQQQWTCWFINTIRCQTRPKLMMFRGNNRVEAKKCPSFSRSHKLANGKIQLVKNLKKKTINWILKQIILLFS